MKKPKSKFLQFVIVALILFTAVFIGEVTDSIWHWKQYIARTTM